MSEHDSIRELIDAIVYADVFDCAVTLEETRNFSQRATSEADLRTLLGKLVDHEIIGEHSGFYFLPGRDQLAKQRPERITRAQKLRDRAHTVAQGLRHLPFVRGLYLTGSVAADYAEPDADLDLLIVVAEGRLASAFIQLGPLSRILSRQVFCPNYYVCETNLTLSRRSHYVAREIAQARPLISEGNPLFANNAWVHERLPNLQPHVGTDSPPRQSLIQRILEYLLRGRLGDRVESWARDLARRRLLVHHKERDSIVPEVIHRQFEAGESLRFHASSKIDRIDEELEKRYHAIDAALARMRTTNSGEVT